MWVWWYWSLHKRMHRPSIRMLEVELIYGLQKEIKNMKWVTYFRYTGNKTVVWWWMCGWHWNQGHELALTMSQNFSTARAILVSIWTFPLDYISTILTRASEDACHSCRFFKIRLRKPCRGAWCRNSSNKIPAPKIMSNLTTLTYPQGWILSVWIIEVR